MPDQSEVETVDCDFLIVGAGSSGCVLASRLVREGLKVLLVEKGPTDDFSLRELVRRPSLWMSSALSGNDVSEVFYTVPQAGLGNRRVHAFNGSGGGGTSNINAGLYCRGTKEDYEENWPWKLKEIEASFKSIEAKLTLEELPQTGTVASSCDRMLEEMGLRRSSPATGRSKEPTWTREGIGGCSMKRMTMNCGKRQSAWSAFVKPVMDMPNLRIKDNAAVTRVIIEGGHAVGIEVVESPSGWRGDRVRQLRLAKDTAEIVLCCGVFRSPKLLMLSGIGPRKHLEEKGVPVVLDMPHVGENLQDHLVIPSTNASKLPMERADFNEDNLHGQVYVSCKLPAPSSVSGRSSGRAGGSGDDTGTGSTPDRRPSAVIGLVNTDGGHFLHLPLLLRLWFAQQGFLPWIIRTMLITLCRIALLIPPTAHSLHNTRGALMAITTVRSRGTVRLASADAAVPPVIDPAYLSHPQDRQAALAIWRMYRMAKTGSPTGRAVFGVELMPGKMYNFGSDDGRFLLYARDNALPFYHPVGTCRMGKRAEDSVVSSDSLRVHGVSGLRVADASVAPRIPSTPIQAMAMMIGDRAASLALNDRAKK